MKKQLLCSVLALMSFIACDKDDNGNNREVNLSMCRMEIADAKMLAICNNGSAVTKSSDEELSLFKIDQNGAMTIVRCIQEGTNEVVELRVPSIIPISNEFILCPRIEYPVQSADGYVWYNWDGDSYLINKTTGRFYRIDRQKYPDINSLEYSFPELSKQKYDINPRTDALGNAYIAVPEKCRIYKFSLKDVDNITMQQINLEQFPVACWYSHPYEVDAFGNCLTYFQDNALGEKILLYKAAGGMFEFPKADGVLNYFVGQDGNFICCSQFGEWRNYEYKFYPIKPGVNVDYDLARAASKKTQTEYAREYRYKHGAYTLKNGYIHVLLSPDNISPNPNTMLVYNSKDNTVKEVGFIPGEMENVVGIDNNSIYRIMDKKIYKYDFIKEEKSVIPIAYDFSGCTTYKDWDTYNVGQGSKFILGAIRNSDMAALRIEVDMETGKTRVFENPQDRQIITLVQVSD